MAGRRPRRQARGGGRAHPSSEIRALAANGIRLNPAADAGTADTLVVAVKPQMFREAGPALKPFVGPNTLVVSIMAGTP